ncbi:rubrerythrin [Candidatus Woesearchaeota archaeon]|nr:rubrerythrin [Candidatus Woesearchaeota archaeon]
MAAKWQCKVCGYVYEGDLPPQRCPKCGMSGANFIKIAEAHEERLKHEEDLSQAEKKRLK